MKSLNRSSPPGARVRPAAMACPPPAVSSPLSLAASTAAPRSTPEMERPEPLPVPSSVSAMTIAGRPNRSLIRPATIPITPWDQPPRLDQRAEADILPRRHDLEALGNEGAVEAFQARDISHRAERDEVEEVDDLRFRDRLEGTARPQLAEQRNAEQEGHSDRGE